MLYGSIKFEGTNKDYWEVLSDKSLHVWHVGLGRQIFYDRDFHHVKISLARRVTALALVILLAPLTLPCLGIGLLAARFSKSYARSWYGLWQARLSPPRDVVSNVPYEVGLLLHRYLDIPKLLAMREVSHHVKNLAEDNAVWRPIAQQLGLEVREGKAINEVKKKYQQLLKQLRELMPHVPPDVQASMRLFPPTIHSLQFMDQWIKARDILCFWQKAVRAVGETLEINRASGRRMIAQAEGFEEWLKGHVDTLTALELMGRYLSYFPPTLSTLTTLSELNLYENQLTSLPPQISHLTNLTDLQLGRNPLNALPTEFWSLTGLRSLVLSGTQMTSLPSQISNLTNLRMLGFSRNKMTSWPIELGCLQKLQRVYLSTNKLDSLPSYISNLTNLNSLDLSGNKLTMLPPEIWNLSSLISLHLNDNQLTSLPSLVSQLTSLRYFYLSRNQLTSLPPEIGNLRNLETFSLNSNSLSSLPNETANLTHLRGLGLKNNHFRSLQSELRLLRNVIRMDFVQKTLVNLAHLLNPTQKMAL